MSEYDWRDGAPPSGGYRTPSKPDRYRLVAVVRGVRFASEETYDYADATRIVADADGYIGMARITKLDAQ